MYIEIIQCFENLKHDNFSGVWVKRLLEFALLLDHSVETAGEVIHDEAQVALLCRV